VAVRAWVVAFLETVCLPSWVRGPVDFWALARLAARRFSERGSFRGGGFEISGFEISEGGVCGSESSAMRLLGAVEGAVVAFDSSNGKAIVMVSPLLEFPS